MQFFYRVIFEIENHFEQQRNHDMYCNSILPEPILSKQRRHLKRLFIMVQYVKFPLVILEVVEVGASKYQLYDFVVRKRAHNPALR